MQRWQLTFTVPRNVPSMAGRPSNSENCNRTSMRDPSCAPDSCRRGSWATE
jgi:hypothetical protein